MEVSIKEFNLFTQKISTAELKNEEFNWNLKIFRHQEMAQRLCRPLTQAQNREETGYTDGPWISDYINQ